MSAIAYKSFFAVPYDILVVPRSGQVLVDKYWLVTSEGVMFYRAGKDIYPQCNSSRETAAYLSTTARYPECRVEKIPLAFLAHAHRIANEQYASWRQQRFGRRSTAPLTPAAASTTSSGSSSTPS